MFGVILDLPKLQYFSAFPTHSWDSPKFHKDSSPRPSHRGKKNAQPLGPATRGTGDWRSLTSRWPFAACWRKLRRWRRTQTAEGRKGPEDLCLCLLMYFKWGLFFAVLYFLRLNLHIGCKVGTNEDETNHWWGFIWNRFIDYRLTYMATRSIPKHGWT